MADGGAQAFADRVQELFPRIMRYLEAQRERELIGLTVTSLQMSSLVVLHRAAPAALSMGELALELGLAESAATRLVDRLLALNLVRRQRDEHDRRVVRVRLSSYGRPLARLVIDRREEQFLRLAEHLEADERDTLLRGLETLLAAMVAMEQEARPAPP